MVEKIVWSLKQFPFSFQYDGKPSSRLVPEWRQSETVKEPTNSKIRQISFTDPVTQLCITSYLREFNDFQALDWMLEFKNNGTVDTPIIEDILPLDVPLSLSSKEKIQLRYSKGSECRMDDFLPITTEIHPKQKVALVPVGGRSSNGVLPFMNLQFQDSGFILAIGWSGQWAATFERTENSLHVCAGMERTHLILHPGEKIRTPRILLVDWRGKDPIKGNNLLRQIILAHYAPRINGKLSIPPISYTAQAVFYSTRKVSESTELKVISHAADAGIEAYWLDACWYGSGKGWNAEVGNWYVKKTFPRGLKPLGKSAHKNNMKFILWFEPERARAGSQIEKEHPEFLLRSDHNPDNCLFNLGMSEARTYITNLISKIISDSGVDIYRQDFNLDPLPYWQTADQPDRIGMTEIRHIEGLYTFWDDLCQRFPGLAIDNCSSGGRRIDLETVSRSFSLWRSDFSDIGGPKYGKGLHAGDQSQIVGLSRWIPLHSGAIWTFASYSFRSAMSHGFTLYGNIPLEQFRVEEVRKAIGELKSIRHYFLGDFYPLLPLTMAYHDWCAYQYHRQDLNAGFAVFLRRHKSPFPTMEVELRMIDTDAEYEISMTNSFDKPSPQRMSGAALSQIKITISELPGSILLRYCRVT